jgi:hypothetical protein
MKRVGRYNITEISLDRILLAFKVRMDEIPHTLSWKFHPLASRNREDIRRFKGIHNGERCFIVANGPSLNKTNLDLLAHEITFGLNRIYLNFDKSSFRPTYYVSVNELILEQFASEISKLDMPKFLNWNRRSYYGNPNSKTLFLKSKMVLRDSFQSNLTDSLVFGATVTFVALQIAYYMGFQKAIIIGLDHSYAEKGVPTKTEIRSSDQDESHFHPQYFPKGIRWQLPDLLRSEIDFQIARNSYERDGREILDATIGGYCQVFHKIDYLSLFSQKFA